MLFIDHDLAIGCLVEGDGAGTRGMCGVVEVKPIELGVVWEVRES